MLASTLAPFAALGLPALPGGAAPLQGLLSLQVLPPAEAKSAMAEGGRRKLAQQSKSARASRHQAAPAAKEPSSRRASKPLLSQAPRLHSLLLPRAAFQLARQDGSACAGLSPGQGGLMASFKPLVAWLALSSAGQPLQLLAALRDTAPPLLSSTKWGLHRIMKHN